MRHLDPIAGPWSLKGLWCPLTQTASTSTPKSMAPLGLPMWSKGPTIKILGVSVLIEPVGKKAKLNNDGLHTGSVLITIFCDNKWIKYSLKFDPYIFKPPLSFLSYIPGNAQRR